MSDQDVLVGSFAGKLSPSETELTDREKALLVKLLSNPAYFPDIFWTTLADKLSMILTDIPISSISGFLKIRRLEDYPANDRMFLRGDAKWVEIAGNPVMTWGEGTVDWSSSTYAWDGK